uniref:bcl-2-like protein 1 n=1 Tax=Styela clava TaxID=7725 RepID=UPI0019397743|nr:bcl-2-like protein 1 [Styela clava]
MTMVYESRKVVEDYVLYKIKNHMHSTSNGDVSVSDLTQQRLTVHNYAHFPLPQDPPSDINYAVRKVASEYEKRYREKYPDILEGIRANHISAGNVDKVFTNITKDLFKISNGGGKRSVTSSPSGGRKSKSPSPALVDPDSIDDSIEDANINWSHVIGLLVFSGVLAVRCVEINQYGQVDDIVNWVSRFLDTRLRRWLRRQGGWGGFVQWSIKGGAVGTSESNEIGAGMRTALRVGGAVAAVALTAMMISRK